MANKHSIKVAFEINHPAQAHLFKNTIKHLEAKGNLCRVFIKENQIIQAILDDEDIQYISLGPKADGYFFKAINQAKYLWKVHQYHKREKFDLGIGVSVTFAVLGRLTSLNSVIFDDDDKKATPLFSLLTHNTATALLRPKALNHEGNRKNTIYYNGYHELAYLHPSVFKPDKTVLHLQGLGEHEPFFLIRLVALKAHHDKGKKGISKTQLKKLVQILIPHGRVFLLNEIEGDLPEGTERLRINPAKIHHLMAFAKLIISDGQTMCSEAACLGVPSVRINDFAGRISYLEEQEKKWGLTFGYKPNKFPQALSKIAELLNQSNELFLRRRNKMVSNSIVVTSFLVWFIENWPESFRVMKEKPEYQWRFR